ncbi:hypothetical protein [Spiroplasma turonicum]|uniref:Uncharacterized protein n=1 Tax=Spiroplasma turonicum TaxID=216946 RepID=A0A0K1P7A4_9MOLU|nr:hypothetical protein [Spiroplasma turonicum]AKU79777.1 hypothetical protein STURON_00531 [Spiroplasma turonicum]ALX70795.1 hypothetical protein STURO_v1c05290 [Spiroplasma turonicum]
MQKFLTFFTVKNKLKLIIFSVVFSVYFLFSLLMVTPGVGVESLRFIKSIENQISKVMPKGVYVVDGQDPSYETIMETVIKKAYSADAVSTLNSYETENYNQKKEDYTNFANKWYESRWSKVKENKGDIDLYDLGIDLISFDEAVSTEFLSYGYVHAGIAWMFQTNGLNEIFSSSIRNDLLRNQTIVDQDLYDSKMKSSDPGVDGIDIYDSPGTLLINNKIWYLNKQIENIKYGMNVFGHNIFKDKSLNESNMSKTSVTADELYTPHFTETLDNLRVGVILFFILLIVVLPGYILVLTMLLISKKKGAK